MPKFKVNPSLVAWDKKVVYEDKMYEGDEEVTLPAAAREHRTKHFGLWVPSFVPVKEVSSEAVDNTTDNTD